MQCQQLAHRRAAFSPAVRHQRVARVSSLSRGTRLVVRAELKVGDKLDDYADYFRVCKTADNKAVTLSSFKGKQPVVLFFYPKASTPGCTKEACKFRDEYKRFVDAGVAVLGISGSSQAENAAFAEANNLPFPLLTDASDFLRKGFGVKSDLLGFLPGRQTYVIDTAGVCVLSFNDQFNAEQHVDEALKVLSKLSVKA